MIENFQSIEAVSFKPLGFTIIVGDSDIGKSSVVRAITGLLLNSLDGGAIRKGKTGTLVRMSYEGHSLQVDRTDSTAVFEVDGALFAKLNRKPCPAIESLGFRAIKIGDTTLTPQWIDDQFTPLFLVDKSPSVAAGMVTQATRLDVISLAAKAGASELRQKRGVLNTREADKTALEVRRELYVEVPTLLIVEQQITQQLHNLEQQSQDLEYLFNLSTQFNAVGVVLLVFDQVGEVAIPSLPTDTLASIGQLHQLAKQLAQVVAITLAFDQVGEVEIPVPPLDTLDSINQLQVLHQKLTQAQNQEELLEGVILEVGTLTHLEQSKIEWEQLVQLSQQLGMYSREEAVQELRVQELEQEERQLDHDRTLAFKEIGVCPLCETELS